MNQSESRELTEDRSGIGQETPPLASCFWCERLHPGEQPLSIRPACVARLSTLRSLEMSRSFTLSDGAIDETLMRTSPGNDALGYMDGDTFLVFYVSRSDSDLRQRLHAWVGKPSRYGRYASPAKASWGVPRRRQLPVDAPALAGVGNVESGYTHFAYSYARSAQESCAKEWHSYGAFGGGLGLDNEAEPICPIHQRTSRRAEASRQ